VRLIVGELAEDAKTPSASPALGVLWTFVTAQPPQHYNELGKERIHWRTQIRYFLNSL
jgi:hypothetical protein